MGFKQYIFNSSYHYSVVFKAAYPIVIQVFIASTLFLHYSIQHKRVENLNPWLRSHLFKLCDLD